jgi:hypothetical protein
MYQFLEQNSLYVVMTIVLVIWIGISYELFKIEKKLKKIEDSKS